MAKNKIAFEKDEKKSIMIAIIVSVVVVLAVMLAFVAIRRYQRAQGISTDVVIETETATVIEGNAIVTNQEELNKALADETATAVLIETDENQTIVIPAGDYSRLSLIVNAPYTEITNYGVFGSVTIQQIASNTWTESVSGNSIIVDAAACHIIVPSGINVNSMENIQSGSTLAVELQGTISLLALESGSSIVSVQVDGELSQIMIYAPTNLTLSGGCRTATSIELAYGSDGTVLNTSIPVKVDTFAQAAVELAEGAEGSELTIADTSAVMTLTNNTAEDVTVKTGENEEIVAAGAAFTNEGEVVAASESEESQASSNPQGSYSRGNSSAGSSSAGSSSGSSSSGSSAGSSSAGSSTTSSSSSGGGYTKEQVEAMIQEAVSDANAQMQNQINTALDGTISQEDAQNLINDAVRDALNDAEKEKQEAVADAVENVLAKPVIIEFVDEACLYAGVQGTIPGAESLSLPKEVYGRASTGDIYVIAVREWKNTDNYSESVPAGTYRFTAVLESSTEYYVAAGVQAYATVYVRPTTNDYFVTYKDAAYKQWINVTEYRVADYSNVQQAYPEAYYLIENISETSVIYAALDFYYYDSRGVMVESEHWNGIYIQPGKSWVAYRSKPCVEYDYYVVEVDNYISRNAKVDSLVEIQPTNASAIEVYKNTDKLISECAVLILYMGSDGQTAYGIESFSSGSTNYKTTINDTSEDAPLAFNLHVPDGADINRSIIVSKGGYE